MPSVLGPASRERCAEALADFPVPYPLTLETLHQAAVAHHHRPLILHREPFPPGLQRPCGLWWPTGEADHIWVAPEAAGTQAVHTYAHELGHQFLGHPPLPVVAVGEKPVGSEEAETFTWLSPAFLAGDLLGVRTRAPSRSRDPLYTEREDEAEAFAALLRQSAELRNSGRNADPLLDRLHRSL
ncbi:hypothetical protein AB0I51_05850 [Streptomyces sp. NPDC050549]|uniref:hypothetical protein n=1 Tax=Streptomyces sp. NPDC050549 TaxID=3155406 RepID=UPI003414E465